MTFANPVGTGIISLSHEEATMESLERQCQLESNAGMVDLWRESGGPQTSRIAPMAPFAARQKREPS